jgi:small multidrug resistance pump
LEDTVAWLYLGVAIVAEVIATSFLKESDGFTKLWPSIITIVGYGVAFFALSQAIRTLDLGIAYAIWAGVGTALIVTVGMVFFHQSLDLAAWIGVGLIVLGVVVINVFSSAAG